MANIANRINALEAAQQGEAARYRQRQARSGIGPKVFSGAITESVEDFFTDMTRFLENNEIDQTQARRWHIDQAKLAHIDDEQEATPTVTQHSTTKQEERPDSGTVRHRYPLRSEHQP